MLCSAGTRQLRIANIAYALFMLNKTPSFKQLGLGYHLREQHFSAK